jgi:hypothetical protein
VDSIISGYINKATPMRERIGIPDDMTAKLMTERLGSGLGQICYFESRILRRNLCSFAIHADSPTAVAK